MRCTSRRSTPLRSTTRPSGLTTTRERPACRRSASATAARAIVSSSSHSWPVRGRKPGSFRLCRAAAARSGSPASSTVLAADQRMPRSPSTVRVTGVGATTSRASPASSGSSSTTEWTSVVAPPTSTTTTSPTAVASSSTPVSTTSGVAPRTIAVKLPRRLRCLPPMTWERKTSRMALRADCGARTPIRGTTLSARTWGRPARVASTSSRASTLLATTTGPRQPPATRARAARSRTSELPPSVPRPPRAPGARGAGSSPWECPPRVPRVSSTPWGASAARWRSGPGPADRTVTPLPPLESAPRRPASAVTSSSFPTTAMRSPPPALEQARTSATPALGSAVTSSARHTSYPSRTSVSIVVRCSAPLTIVPSARSTRRALVNVEPKPTQTARSAKGLVEVGQEAVDGLDSDAEPDQVRRHLELGARHAGVGHPPGVLDQRLDAAERLGQREHAGAVAHLERALLAALRAERHHAAEAVHLAVGHLVAGVVRQPGVVDLLHPLVGSEELDDAFGVVAVALHPDRQRLEAAQGQPGIERAGHRAHGVLVVADLLGEVQVPHDDRSPDHVAVSTGVLGRRVDDDVRAQGQRTLEVRRREGVVDHEQGAGLVGDVGQGGDVGDPEQRVGRRLDPDHLRPVGDGSAYRVEVVEPDRRVDQAPALEHLVEEPVRAAVRVVGQHHVVTGVEQPADHGVLGGQAGGEREPLLALLERGDGLLECGPGRVGRAAVLVAPAQATDPVLLVGRRGEDGRDHRPGRRVRLVSRVDRPRLETGLLPVLLAHLARVSTSGDWPHPPGCRRLTARGT